MITSIFYGRVIYGYLKGTNFLVLGCMVIAKISSALVNDFVRKSQISLGKRKNFGKKQASTAKISSVTEIETIQALSSRKLS